MEPQPWTHDDFPESTATAPGMVRIEAATQERCVFVHVKVPYAVKSGRALHVMILRPTLDPVTTATDQASAERFPLLVYVQGAGWGEQELGGCLDVLIPFAARGYVIAVVEHRPASLAPFPAQAADAVTATRWLTEHADEYQIDPDRVALWGDSSGGHTTLMVAVAGTDPSIAGAAEAPDFMCFVDFYGPTALDRMNDEPASGDHLAAHSPEGILLGGRDLREVPDLVRRADPASWVSADRPLRPIFIAHGSKDRVVPFQQSVLVYQALRAAGQPVQLVQIRGAGHGGPSFWSSGVLEMVAGFLQRHLG
jgi:acetyl esterase/lipase